LEHLIPHLIWAGVLSVAGLIALFRAARPSCRDDAPKGQQGIWSSLVFLYLAVGLLVWGLVAEQHRLHESLSRLSDDRSRLSERIRVLESRQ